MVYSCFSCRAHALRRRLFYWRNRVYTLGIVPLFGLFEGLGFSYPIAILLGLPGIFWIVQLLFIVLFLITFVPLKNILQKYSSSSLFFWFVIVSSYFIYYVILIYIGTC